MDKVEEDKISGSPEKLRQEPFDEDDKYPEGGLRAWLVVLGAWAGMVACFGVVNSTGYLQAWLANHQLQDYSESQISWIFSLHFFFFCCGGVLVGPIFDKCGLTPLLIPGSLGTIASQFILSVCTKYYQFLLGFSILGGLSGSMLFTPCITAMGHWFLERRAMATGIAASGGAFGGIVYPLFLGKSMPSIGYGWSIRIMAFINVAMCLTTVLTLKTRVRDETKLKFSNALDLKSLSDVRFALTTTAIFLIEWGLFIPVAYLPSWGLANGLSDKTSNHLLAIFNAGSLVGRAAPGFVADKVGRFNMMILMTALSALFCYSVWLTAGGSHSAAKIIVFAVLMGLSSGSGISMTPVCVSQICRIEDYGKRYGTCYFISSFGILTGLPIAGQILSLQKGDYQGLVLFAGSSYLAGLLCFIGVRWMSEGFKICKF